MIRFCTHIDAVNLPQGLALLRSLQRHAGDFHVHVLTSDDQVAAAVEKQTGQCVSTLRLPTLLNTIPELTASRNELTELAFGFYLRPWLLRHVLSTIPVNCLLTLLEPNVFFLRSPHSIFNAVGEASIALVRNGDLPSFGRAWVTLRHDSIGLACASAWVKRSLQPVNTLWLAHRDHLLERSFPQTDPAHTAVIVDSVTSAPALINKEKAAADTVNGQKLIALHFNGLQRLSLGIYDPGSELRHIQLPAQLRDLIYLPYLRELEASVQSDLAPDIIPLANPDDPRAGQVLGHIQAQVTSEAHTRDYIIEALARIHLENRRLIDEARAKSVENEHYLHQVERDRDQQRQAFFDTRKRLEEVHQDLLHNISYLKKLEAEAAAQQQASQDRETFISSLKQQLAAQKMSPGHGPDLQQLQVALRPHAREIRRLLVVRFNPALLPLILTFASQGVSIEVLESPAELAGETNGSVHFLGGKLWDWLGGLNSFFNETDYLRKNPDLAPAIATGVVSSGWDHYLHFGQYEGRDSGTNNFRAGLSDFDAVAFDSADAAPIIPCLIGRLQSHQRLFISNSFNPATVWLPSDTPRTIVVDDLLCCPHPPPTWIGPHLPAAIPVPHRQHPSEKDIYPESPKQPAVWPKITVITTGQNQATSLEVTLESVLSQRYPMLEFIVVDRASTDETAAILEQHAEQLAWWSSEPCPHAASALNLGLKQSTGSIIAWLNAGDQLAPGCLFTVAQQFLLHAPDLIAGRCDVETADNSTYVHRSVLTLGQIQPLPLNELIDLDNFYLSDAFFRQPAVFLARSAWESIGFKLGEEWPLACDYELWLRLARINGKVLPLPEILARQAPVPSNHTRDIELKAVRDLHAKAIPVLHPA